MAKGKIPSTTTDKCKWSSIQFRSCVVKSGEWREEGRTRTLIAKGEV